MASKSSSKSRKSPRQPAPSALSGIAAVAKSAIAATSNIVVSLLPHHAEQLAKVSAELGLDVAHYAANIIALHLAHQPTREKYEQPGPAAGSVVEELQSAFNDPAVRAHARALVDELRKQSAESVEDALPHLLSFLGVSPSTNAPNPGAPVGHDPERLARKTALVPVPDDVTVVPNPGDPVGEDPARAAL